MRKKAAGKVSNMDVTFRGIDEAVFRKFKAKCAEAGISMGQGFNLSAAKWIGGFVATAKEQKEWNKDTHLLRDLSLHLHELHRKEGGGAVGAPARKGKK